MANNKDTEKNKEMCFVIMPFSDPDGYEKGHFKKIYEQLIKPAIIEAGYVPRREDDDSGSTVIQANIFDSLITAPMVLCDLSTKNPNVLYELGIRHAFDKPVVLICEEGQSPIFDIAGVKTTSYRKERLYDEVLEDQKKIAKAIMETRDLPKSFSFMKLVDMQPAIEVKGETLSNEARNSMMLSVLYNKMTDLEKAISKRSHEDEPIVNTQALSYMDKKRFIVKLEEAERTYNELISVGSELDKFKLLELERIMDELVKESINFNLPYTYARRLSSLRERIKEKL